MNGLQGALATAAIALSAFSLITYLWLGLTVLLLGNRRVPVTWVGGLGLLSAALFFLCHGALVGAGVTATAGADVWWHLSWLPAFAAPLFWATIGLHYVGMAGAWGRLRILALAGAATLGGLAAVLVLVNWRAIASYGDFIRLLSVALGTHRGSTQTAAALASPAMPALAVAFVAFVGACASLPWASLVARRFLPGGVPVQPSAARSESALMWDASSAWTQARPALLAASLCMLVAGSVVGAVGVLTSLAIRTSHLSNVMRPHLPLPTAAPVPGHLPLALVLADLTVQLAMASLVLMLGWAVVRQGVLVERRLPQRGFLGHWRSTVGVAGVVAAMVAWLTFLEPESLAALLGLVALVAATYALFTWRSYVAHDRFLEQLRPFVDSLATSRGGWLATSPQDVEHAVEALFNSLCRDVLGASRGHLALSAGHLHRTFEYTTPDGIPLDAKTAREWVLPVSDERGVVARLSLGPRLDGAGYTSADLEVARACGQRILDAVGEFTAVQTIAQLARRRGLEAELSAALPRRKLHDEVLPRLHLALLRLESLRGRLGDPAHILAERALVARGASTPATLSHDAAGPATADAEIAAALGEVVRELGGVHHDLAALMRASPAAAPRRLEHGFCAALRKALDGEFNGAFDALTWAVPDDAQASADSLPDIVADVLLGATLEAVRNASRHARGSDLHRPLELALAITADERWVSVTVMDDGVGLQQDARGEGTRSALAPLTPSGRITGAPPPSPAVVDASQSGPSDRQPAERAAASTRSGLLTHSALLALVGGSLVVQNAPRTGTIVTLRVPRVQESPGV